MKGALGKLDRRVRIERKTVTQDATYGTDVETWSTVAIIWVNWQDELPSKAETIERGGLRVAVRRARLRARYMRGLNSDMRVKPMWGVIPWDSRHWWSDTLIFQIVGGPVEMGQKDGIEMMVEEVTTHAETQP